MRGFASAWPMAELLQAPAAGDAKFGHQGELAA